MSPTRICWVTLPLEQARDTPLAVLLLLVDTMTYTRGTAAAAAARLDASVHHDVNAVSGRRQDDAHSRLVASRRQSTDAASCTKHTPGDARPAAAELPKDSSCKVFLSIIPNCDWIANQPPKPTHHPPTPIHPTYSPCPPTCARDTAMVLMTAFTSDCSALVLRSLSQ